MKEAYSFDDVLILPEYSEIGSRFDCDTSPNLPFLNMSIPVFAANMDTICGVKMVKKMDELGGCGILHRSMKVTEVFSIISDLVLERMPETLQPSPIIISVGSVHQDKRRIDLILSESNSEYRFGICVDLAHGDTKHMKDTLHYIRSHGFKGLIIAGNICTREGAERLFDFGADIVKVGVGPGSACTTREKTGCGFPQLSAVEECSKVGPVIADGGIRKPGDAAKALAVGAQAVMVGGILAGTDCTPSWTPSPVTNLEFRGMASEEAKASCGASIRNVEGISTRVPWKPKGSTQDVIEDLVDGIRSAMSYTGAKTLLDFRTKSRIIKTTGTITKENEPHIITKLGDC